MIPTVHNLTYLVGGKTFDFRPNKPFAEQAIAFLNSLSAELRALPEARAFPDVITYAFWCRKSNLDRLYEEFKDGYLQLGRGMIFHIAPSNVPVNFAYSLAFGLLSGNANLIRVSSKPFPQVELICRAINNLLKTPEYFTFTPYLHIFRYEHNDTVTAELSAQCDGRIIWGGDATIRHIRQHQIKERGVDIAFADRFSFAAIDSQSVLHMQPQDLQRLAGAFYNDTFMMDQNACSSPHFVLWLGTTDTTHKARSVFWENLYGITKKKYEISDKMAVDKYTLFCQNSIELNSIKSTQRFDNYIYNIDLASIPKNIDEMRGSGGYFYEYQTTDLNEIAPVVNQKYQTLCYYGIPKEQLQRFVLDNRLTGIDRVVPIGSALDINPVWDGYHVIKSLSRIIDIR